MREVFPSLGLVQPENGHFPRLNLHLRRERRQGWPGKRQCTKDSRARSEGPQLLQTRTSTNPQQQLHQQQQQLYLKLHRVHAVPGFGAWGSAVGEFCTCAQKQWIPQGSPERDKSVRILRSCVQFGPCGSLEATAIAGCSAQASHSSAF